MSLTNETIQVDSSGWTASNTIAVISSVGANNLNPGDVIQVWGSATGEEANTDLGVEVGTVYLDPTLGVTVTPNPKYWSAFAYYALIQIQGDTTNGQVVIGGH